MIGILGGSFDPIHYGHLRTALDVQQTLNLEQIRLIPLLNPPHRDVLASGAETRLAMVRAAVADEPRFRVDDRELARSGKSYTLNTLLPAGGAGRTTDLLVAGYGRVPWIPRLAQTW